MRLGRHILAAGCMILCLSCAAAHAQTFNELYNDGVKARLEQRFDDAARLLDQALALQPSNTDAILQLGFVELARNNLPAAEASFARVLALAPNYSDATFGQAQVKFRKGDLAAAQALIEPLARKEPGRKEFADLLKSVSEARRVAEKTATARAAAQQRKVRRDEAGRLMKIATRQRLAGQYDRAARNYRKLLALGPKNGDALTALGLIAGAQKKFAEASRYFHRALAIDGRNLDARLGLARLALWQDDVPSARTQVDRILGAAPDNSEALLLDGQLSLIGKDYARAEMAYNHVLAMAPGNVEGWIGLGDTLRAKGDGRGARAAYDKALRLDPTSTVIRDRLAAPFPTLWRLDAATEISELSKGRGTWTDSSVSISYRATPELTLSSRARTATRFGFTDVQGEMRADYSFIPEFTVYGLSAVTPEADFLAQYLFGAGMSWQAVPAQNGLGPFTLNLDTRYEHFSESDIVTLSPWIQAYLFDERLGLSARWVHVEDDHDASVDGYVLRGDIRLADAVLVFGGYSDAPEISEGAIIDTETWFTGLTVDINDALSLHGSYAREKREAFDRDIYGLGVTVRF